MKADGYSPIAGYAAIGDGHTIALVSMGGSVDWLPVPRLDAVPVFAAMLDESEGGRIALAPAGDHTVRRRYLPGTNVLETEYTTEKGRVRVTDALVTGTGGTLPWTELTRRIDGLAGTVTMDWSVQPGTLLRTASPWIDRIGGTELLRVDAVTIAVTGVSVKRVGSVSLGGRLRVSEGSRRTITVVATHDEPVHVPSADDVARGTDITVSNWRAWSSEFSYDGPWADPVRRSALALKLLTDSSTGAIAAAGTTSLPESPAGDKNWDYRYAWVRDTAYTLRALVRFGLREETHAAMAWLLAAVKDSAPDLRILYGLTGASDVRERRFESPGWCAIGPVVAGNRAIDQRQLGVYGDLLSVALAYTSPGNILDRGTARLLSDIADRVCDRWRQRDSGMWELEQQRHYTSSKMGCWQALTAALRLADAGQISGDVARWRTERSRIHTWVDAHCWSERLRSYVMYEGSEELDASVLLHAPSGFDRGARMSSTIDAVVGDLGRGALVYRYSSAIGSEHPFVACSFWLAAAYECVGRHAAARTQMDDTLALANDVGLFSEMIAEDGTFWGNFPQGLSHLALIDAAMTIDELS
jgi:GH15 family glucan-1,4-alpha-glucosidase